MALPGQDPPGLEAWTTASPLYVNWAENFNMLLAVAAPFLLSFFGGGSPDVFFTFFGKHSTAKLIPWYPGKHRESRLTAARPDRRTVAGPSSSDLRQSGTWEFNFRLAGTFSEHKVIIPSSDSTVPRKFDAKHNLIHSIVSNPL